MHEVKMHFLRIISKVYLFSFCFLFVSEGFASNVNWSGLYRIEGTSIKNSELNDKGRQKDYGLHHLILRPKIVAADGLIIKGQFHIFNATDSAYGNSQLGQIFGSGVNTGGTPDSNRNSNSMSQNQKAEDIQVSQLYLTYIHEYGHLIAGRAPVDFGLGITHNAGMGLFDHWYDNRDMVAYKMVMGNLWLMPMIGKVSEGALNRSDDVTDYMIQFQYENLETNLEMGVFWQIRKAGDQGTDGPINDNFWPSGSTYGSMDVENINVFAKRDNETWMLGLEAGFQKGEIGIISPSGEKVTQSGVGIAVEGEYRPEGSKTQFGILAGTATGDKKSTTGEFEGFLFDRNYDVGFLLFNHTLGQDDFLSTAIDGGGPNSGQNDKADVEALSNVMYFAPYMNYAWNDRWSSKLRLVTGQLQEEVVTDQTSMQLGYELDVSLTFIPKKGITWVNEVGFLLPGDAFKGDGSLDASFGYGMQTKAAISF